jgi:uncharacterized damage-inducible protein DinB
MPSTTRADMFLDLTDDPREVRPPMPDERSTLMVYLRDQRLTLEIKCSGLDAEAMAARSVPPSTMSLLGLVRHLADVERSWMRRFMAGLDAPPLFWTPEDRDGEFDNAVADPALVDEAWAAWRAECAFTDAFVADAPDLGSAGTDPSKMHGTLRQVLVHLIEEYARHNGHADLLRELIDGRIGE